MGLNMCVANDYQMMCFEAMRVLRSYLLYLESGSECLCVRNCVFLCILSHGCVEDIINGRYK